MNITLGEFLTTNRDEIISRARAKAVKRTAPLATDLELKNGIPLFLTQLVGMLRSSGASLGDAAIDDGATKHGGDMRRMGFTVGQVVQDYGGLCQAITELAVESDTPIATDEFKILNHCLDGAVASAVTEFGRKRAESIENQGVERLGVLAHELRNALNIATLAFGALQSGTVGTSGSTGEVLSRSLARMRGLVDRSLTEVRLSAGVYKRTPLSVSTLIEEVVVAGAIEAAQRGVQLTVKPAGEDVTILADAQLLVSALSNLLQNAFKFTAAAGHVSLRTVTTDDVVRIEIEDECGGLPPGKSEDLFRMFEQRGADRSGLGLGLAITRQGVEESGGVVHVRDVPGKGCIFIVELPRQK